MTVADFDSAVQALWCSSFKTLKVIFLSNLLALSVPDEGYCRNESTLISNTSAVLKQRRQIKWGKTILLNGIK